jgi:hypothetical protein
MQARAQVVHSINQNPDAPTREGGGTHVSALFHSHLVVFIEYCYVAIF